MFSRTLYLYRGRSGCFDSSASELSRIRWFIRKGISDDWVFAFDAFTRTLAHQNRYFNLVIIQLLMRSRVRWLPKVVFLGLIPLTFGCILAFQ